MKLQIVRKPSDLRKRIVRFLDSAHFSRGEFKILFQDLEKLGELAIFGGMLRDISVLGSRGFTSDIDLVVKTNRAEDLKRLLTKYNTKINKFGGYRLVVDKRYIDIWSFDTTWAFQKGHVNGNELSDLCKTTFFDWDAIIFNYSSGMVHSIDNYIERLNQRILNINLEPNPNPLAALSKALKYCENYEAFLSNELALYFYKVLSSVINQPVSFPYKIKEIKNCNLSRLSFNNIYTSLDKYHQSQSDIPFTFFNQKDLSLNSYN